MCGDDDGDREGGQVKGFEGTGFEVLADSLERDLAKVSVTSFFVDEHQSGSVCFGRSERGVELSWSTANEVLGARAFTPAHDALNDPLTSAVAVVLTRLGYRVALEMHEGGWLSVVVAGMAPKDE
jgi:hypothetical protein